jgi:Uma2 family endonuclease
MAQAALRAANWLTIADYLAHDDGTDQRYELVDGELLAIPTESLGNLNIAKFLLFELARHFPIAWVAVNTEIAVSGRRAKCRLPDLMVHSAESYEALIGAQRATLLHDMPPPLLVVEVVSPGVRIVTAITAINEPNMRRAGLPNIGLLTLKCGKLLSASGSMGSMKIRSTRVIE